MGSSELLNGFRSRYRRKFEPLDTVFAHIRRGNRIFIGTGCGEPRHLVNTLVAYVAAHPKALSGAELFHVWSLGVAPYTDDRFKDNFRHNSFFVADATRDAVNRGAADYTPVFLSNVPDLFRSRLIPVDVALVQVSTPDAHGFMSLGISVDIVKAAVESASLVVAQINPRMPRVHGDTFVHIDDIDFAMPFEEPLFEIDETPQTSVSERIGEYIARLIEDGDTLQVGYGSVPNAVLGNLRDKRDLGIHSELLTSGVVELMRGGVVNNSRKSLNRDKAVAAFCMADGDTYEFLNDNPAVEFHPIDYTNDPRLIARQKNMTAINSALEIDLTGQASAESVRGTFFSGVGGQSDFMRGACLAPGGKTILAIPSTADNGKVSRIVPALESGTGVTLHRGDVHYVVSEYGIAYLHGKNIRERAMELISIAHPDFQGELIREAKDRNLIYRDQAFIPGRKGHYPDELERFQHLKKSGLDILLRPVKISDEPLVKDFFYSLSDKSLYRRFMSARTDIPHERLQDFVVIDYTREMIVLATIGGEHNEKVLGIGQYGLDEISHTAEVALAVRDEYQNMKIGTTLLEYLYELARKRGLHGFTAEVLTENDPMMRVFENMGFDIHKQSEHGVYEMKMAFRSRETT